MMLKEKPASMEKSIKQAPRASDFCASLDIPLVRFGSAPWTIGSACEGTLILGGTGSGKSSGSGAYIARSFLRAGMGGLILCAKVDERPRWEALAKECGREKSVIVLDGSGRERFNFLDYTLLRDGGGAGQTLNLVTLFVQLAEAANKRKSSSNGGDSFFRDAMNELMSNCMDALIAAYGRLQLHEMHQFIASLPDRESKQEDGFCYKTMQKAFKDPVIRMSENDWKMTDNYIYNTMRYMADRTRTGVIANFSSLVNPFAKGKMHEIFCTNSTLVPELTHEGALIIVDLPIKEWDTAGVLAANVMKYLWQKATERRDCNANTRPVFLWADECQNFMSEYDNEFQSTARSARACSVYLTQNLSGIYSTIGGQNPEHAADALFSNLRTKILHANENRLTNQWAADLIGKDIQQRRNWSFSKGANRGTNESKSSQWGANRGYSSNGTQSGSSGGSSWGGGSSRGTSQGTNENMSAGTTEQVDYRVQPSFFSDGLRMGGAKNKHKVDAVIFQPAQKFNDTGAQFGLCTFLQQ
jgi:hypothetical protein